MPRRPRKRRRSLLVQPVTFSPFARSIAHIVSAHMMKRRMLDDPAPRPPLVPKDDRSVKPELEEESSEAPESSEGEEEQEEEDSDGVVQADFAFFDPKPDDFHGVKILMQTYLDNKQWDLSGFVDLVLGQSTVGTVVKIEDDEDAGIFGVVSALNLERYKDHKCIKEVKDFLLKACQEKDIMDNLRLLLQEQARSVGLLVSQHVVNLPPQLLPHLYDGLFDEISWAIEDEPTKELRNSFRFKSYLLISRIYKHKSAVQKKKHIGNDEEAIIYIKPEDEIFHKLCSWSFSFPLHTEEVSTHELRNYQLVGLVMAIETDKIPIFRKQLRSFIQESS